MRRTVQQSAVTVLVAVATLAGVLALPAASATPPPPPTGSLGQLLGAEGCVQDTTGLPPSSDGCGPAHGLKAAGAMQISPDGAFAFVVGSTGGGSIAAFSRDDITGALTQVAGSSGCVSASAVAGCSVIGELSGVASILISSDGKQLYAAMPAAAKVLILNVNADGSLSRNSAAAGCISNSAIPSSSCSPGSGMPRPDALALADGGATLYVASYSDGSATGSLAAFDLQGVGPQFRSCIQSGTTAQPCSAAAGLDNAVGLATRGSVVYVAAFGQGVSGAVTVVTDSGLTGPAGLATTACYGTLATCTPARAVNGAADVVVSPDGNNVYVGHQDLSGNDGSFLGGGVAVFYRNSSDGTLTQQPGSAGCIVEGTVPAADASCARGRGLVGVGAIAVSPDNLNVYSASALNNPSATNTANTGSSAVAVFARALQTGTDTPTAGILTQPAGTTGCMSFTSADGCAVARGLDSPGNAARSLALSPTGSFLYAAAATGQSVAAFGRQGSDLRLTAVPDAGPYTVGHTYNLTLTVTNAGALIAHNVKVRDGLAPGGAVVGATSSQGTCTINPTVCNVGTLKVDASATVVIQWQPTAAGTTTSTARTGADEGDASPADNIAVTSLASGSTTLAVVGGAGQSAQVGTAFTGPLKASIKDSGGNPLQGVQVTFTAPDSGASAFFAGANSETVTTDATGVATSTTPIANNSVGSYTVAVSSPGATTQNVTLTNDATGPSPSPSPSATPTATISPSPSASGSPSAGARTSMLLQLTSPSTITPGIHSTMRAFGSAGQPVTLRCYSRSPQNSQPGSGPPPYFDARHDVVTSGGFVDFSLMPGTNTRCFVRYSDVADSDTTASNTLVQNVASALSLSAYRDGVLRYHFQGTILPHRAGQLITLYRLDATGREIRTATTMTDASGIWRINRTFTGSGQFTFRARTGQTLTNAAGVSNSRLTVIH